MKHALVHVGPHAIGGKGELLVSRLAFEEVGSEVPVTAGAHRPRQPQNLEFSQA